MEYRLISRYIPFYFVRATFKGENGKGFDAKK